MICEELGLFGSLGVLGAFCVILWRGLRASMRAEDEGYVSQRAGITALERIVMLNVYVAVLLLVVWYLFFAGAPAPTICPTGTVC